MYNKQKQVNWREIKVDKYKYLFLMDLKLHHLTYLFLLYLYYLSAFYLLILRHMFVESYILICVVQDNFYEEQEGKASFANMGLSVRGRHRFWVRMTSDFSHGGSHFRT